MILDALKPVADIINKFIPDGAEKNRLAAELEKASMEVDKQRLEATSKMLGSNSFFVAGAIPSILWVLVVSVVNNYILMSWAKVFGFAVPDVSLPSEYWSLVGWVVTGLLAKKAVDGNAFYSKDGSLLKPSRTDPACNTVVAANTVSQVATPQKAAATPSSRIIFDQDIPDDEVAVEPDANVTPTNDPDYYNKRFEELTRKYQ